MKSAILIRFIEVCDMMQKPKMSPYEISINIKKKIDQSREMAERRTDGIK